MEGTRLASFGIEKGVELTLQYPCDIPELNDRNGPLIAILHNFDPRAVAIEANDIEASRTFHHQQRIPRIGPHAIGMLDLLRWLQLRDAPCLAILFHLYAK